MSKILIDEEALLSIMAAAAVHKFKDKLEGYNSPIEAIILDAFKINEPTIRKAIYEATTTTVESAEFVSALKGALSHKLANLVINKCSGLVEKSFQAIMQDQALRTKLQAAVVDIIEGGK